MATTVADPPAPDLEQQPQPGADPAAPAPGSPGSQPARPERKCANCGQPLAPGQDWCLHCGTAAPGALTARSPGWRSAAAILGATAILVLAAAAAAYAALTQPSVPGQVTQTVAQAPAAPATPAPAAPAAPPATTPTPTPAAPSKPPPVPAAKPPKIPVVAAVPKTSPTAPKTTATTKTPTTPTKTTPSSEQQPAILLDTNAASTYNPTHLPEASFGDPALAIDGEDTTGWTAVVEPATAPKMAAGLLIDLKDTQRLSAAEVVTATPGLTAALYGSSARAVPPAITSPEWTALNKSAVIKQRHTRISLAHSGSGFRFVVLWISRAPASAVGTPQAPGRVTVNELELFATKK